MHGQLPDGARGDPPSLPGWLGARHLRLLQRLARADPSAGQKRYVTTKGRPPATSLLEIQGQFRATWVAPQRPGVAQSHRRRKGDKTVCLSGQLASTTPSPPAPSAPRAHRWSLSLGLSTTTKQSGTFTPLLYSSSMSLACAVEIRQRSAPGKHGGRPNGTPLCSMPRCRTSRRYPNACDILSGWMRHFDYILSVSVGIHATVRNI